MKAKQIAGANKEIPAVFMLADAQDAVRSISHWERGVQPCDEEASLGSWIGSEVNAKLRRLQPTNPNDSSVIALGALLALPGSERFVLFIGKMVSATALTESLKAYVLPIDIAVQLNPSNCDFMRIGGPTSSHIPGVKNAPSTVKWLQTFATIRYEPEIDFTREQLNNCEIRYIDDFLTQLLSNFWVKGYESCLMTNTDLEIPSHLVFAPSMLHVAAICIENALKKNNNPLKKDSSKALAAAGSEMSAYALFQKGDLDLDERETKKFLKYPWAKALEDALISDELYLEQPGTIQFLMSLRDVRNVSDCLESHRSPEAVIEAMANPPENVLCFMNLKLSGVPLRPVLHKDSKTPLTPIAKIYHRTVVSPMFEGRLHPAFQDSVCPHLSTLHSSPMKDEVSSKAQVVKEMMGFEQDYSVKRVRSYRPRDLAKFYFFELGRSVQSLLAFENKVQQHQDSGALPF